MKLLSKSLLVCVALLMSNAALAEPKEFPQADANGDGVMDATEFANSGYEDKSFAEVDLNKDGKISKEEYEEALADCA